LSKSVVIFDDENWSSRRHCFFLTISGVVVSMSD
jgi:hypothetical protein